MTYKLKDLFQPAEFWGRIARSELRWIKDFDTIMNCDMEKGEFKWFEGGVLNASGINAILPIPMKSDVLFCQFVLQ